MPTVLCQYFNQELPGLDAPPFPGDLGERIFKHVSLQAWEQWLGQQTILINEYRLDPLDPETDAFLDKEMVKFLFNEPEA